MSELMHYWGQWLRPSAGLPVVQWSLLLACASAIGYLFQRHIGLPKVVGYSVVGLLAGLLGFQGMLWPLQGLGLFVIELGIALVLFECGGRLPLRWFRHNPMVLVQSLAESALTFITAYAVLTWLGVAARAAAPLAIIAMASSPAILSRVVTDTRAAGAVTERAIVLATLSSLYALALGTARAETLQRTEPGVLAFITPVIVVLGVSILVALALALLLQLVLRIISPTSENTAILLLTLITAASTISAHLGGSAALTGLLAGMLLKQLHPRPWAWPRQLGTASSMLTMLMFVMVSTVAVQADWSLALASVVGALILARLLAKIVGVAVGNIGSGASWKQALWVGSAMTPMSSIALLITSQFVVASPSTGYLISRVALPTILLMELLGAMVTALALYQAGESAKPWGPTSVTALNAAAGDHTPPDSRLPQ